MAFTWSKNSPNGWSSADEGSVLSGAELGAMQDDLDGQAVALAGTQTITGNKTLSGTNTHSGTNTFSGAVTHSGTETFTGQVVFTNKSCITCLSTTTGVDMKTAGVTVLYTVPATKTLIITHVVVRNPSATLAGGTDYDFGTSSACSTWMQSVNLSTMTTATTDFMVIANTAVTKFTTTAAGAIFAIKVSTGSTGAATCDIDLFGYLV
jgi:hypothetical protein